MNRPGIPCGHCIELRFSAVVFGPESPAVRCEWWSTSGGQPAFTGKYVIIPVSVVGKLAATLREAAAEAMVGPLFAPAEERQ